jgi:hypothetical protein
VLKQARKVLVESFVGAIALGWLFSQGILHFTFVFSTPVASWISRRQLSGFYGEHRISTDFSFQDAIPELIRSFSLLLIGYLLLRWLYFKPLEEEKESTPEAELGGNG